MSIAILAHRMNQFSAGLPYRFRRLMAMLVVGCIGVLGGCGEGTQNNSASEPESRQASGGSGGSGYSVDMDAIFPQGPGRSLVLNNCQNCHTWVPIVILQMNEQEWDRWSREHRQRVEGLADDEFSTLLSYLKVNFNPNTPVPELPPALLEAWTTY